MSIQERETPEWPLCVRIICRLLCGVVAAGILGGIGWCVGTRQTMMVGAGLGLVMGLVAGERAFQAMINVVFFSSLPPPP